MKKGLLIFVCFLVLTVACFSDENVKKDNLAYIVAGVEYNPLNPDYIAWNAGINLAVYRNGPNKFFWETRFGGGAINYSWEGPNPYTVQHENINLWQKMSLYFLTHNSAFWQYDLNKFIGFRAGLTIPILISDIFSYDFPIAVTIYGRTGIVLFPNSKFNLAIEAHPGLLAGKFINFRVCVVIICGLWFNHNCGSVR